MSEFQDIILWKGTNNKPVEISPINKEIYGNELYVYLMKNLKLDKCLKKYDASPPALIPLEYEIKNLNFSDCFTNKNYYDFVSEYYGIPHEIIANPNNKKNTSSLHADDIDAFNFANLAIAKLSTYPKTIETTIKFINWEIPFQKIKESQEKKEIVMEVTEEASEEIEFKMPHKHFNWLPIIV
jgi:RNAse (barnase) inhibitor barstar